jgi:hypothetical protein
MSATKCHLVLTGAAVYHNGLPDDTACDEGLTATTVCHVVLTGTTVCH